MGTPETVADRPFDVEPRVAASLVDGLLVERYAYPPGRAEALPRHAHSEYQLCLSLGFAGEYWYRRARHPVPPRSLTVIHPGEVHAARDPIDRDRPAHYVVLYLPGPWMACAASSLALGRREPFLDPPVLTDPRLLRLVARLGHRWRADRSRLSRESALLEALRGLLLVAGAPEEPEPRPTRARQAVTAARRHLEDHVAEPVSLLRLASVAGLSPFHLAREFRRLVGLPPHAFQTQLRVMQARPAILAGRPLAEVAAHVGFADQSHLGRHFKRLMMVSPGAYAAGARSF